MRNISFHLTQQQILARTKTVTRRLGWKWLVEQWSKDEREIYLQPIVKGQGIPKGGKVEKLGNPIRIVQAGFQKLNHITQDDVRREGFPDWTPSDFIEFFCKANGCKRTTKVTVITFIYT